jgi:hypothetical protein
MPFVSACFFLPIQRLPESLNLHIIKNFYGNASQADQFYDNPLPTL